MNFLFLVILVILSCCFVSSNDEVCINGACPVQNGFAPTRVFHSNSVLKLVGTGIRRKNLVFIDVDVYAIGFYISDKKINDLKKNSKVSLSQGINKALGGYADEVQAGIVLKFLRNVETKKIVDAIGDSLSMKQSNKEYLNELESFKLYLTNLVGKSGAKLGDEIEFVFKQKNNDEFGISVNKSKIQWLKNSQLRINLIEIYSDNEKCVSLDLVKSLVSTIKTL